jgi:hypothetical protein
MYLLGIYPSSVVGYLCRTSLLRGHHHALEKYTRPDKKTLDIMRSGPGHQPGFTPFSFGGDGPIGSADRRPTKSLKLWHNEKPKS